MWGGGGGGGGGGGINPLHFYLFTRSTCAPFLTDYCPSPPLYRRTNTHTHTHTPPYTFALHDSSSPVQSLQQHRPWVPRYRRAGGQLRHRHPRHPAPRGIRDILCVPHRRRDLWSFKRPPGVQWQETPRVPEPVYLRQRRRLQRHYEGEEQRLWEHLRLPRRRWLGRRDGPRVAQLPEAGGRRRRAPVRWRMK